jgi:hypothetical protein
MSSTSQAVPDSPRTQQRKRRVKALDALMPCVLKNRLVAAELRCANLITQISILQGKRRRPLEKLQLVLLERQKENKILASHVNRLSRELADAKLSQTRGLQVPVAIFRQKTEEYKKKVLEHIHLQKIDWLQFVFDCTGGRTGGTAEGCE